MRLVGIARAAWVALVFCLSFQSGAAGLDNASVSALLGGMALPSLPQQTIATGAPGVDASQPPTVIPVQTEEHSSIEEAFNRRLKTSGMIKSAGGGGSSASAGGADATASDVLISDKSPQSTHLKQFGYSVFSNPSSKFSPLTDIPIPPEYVLGPGDELRVQYYGSRSDSLSLTVDRNGMVNVPDIGEIGLSGLSYNIARATLAEQISKKLTGVTASITMGHLRSIRIFVLGDVRNPGTYLVSSLSTLSHVLFASGGPSKSGSLRHIQLKRGGKRIAEIDMYDFLLKGDGKNDKQLMPGDVVFVPPIGDMVAVAGEVTRPGIYEMKQERGVKEIIDLAGRPLHTADKLRVEIDRLKPNGTREMVDFDLDKAGKESLRPGDLVVFYPLLEDLSEYVSLSGAVKRPGRYGFKAGMKLSDLVRSLDDLLPQSYLRRVEVTHHTVQDGESRVTSRDEVNLENALAGDAAANITLKSYDEVLVRSIADWGDAILVRVDGEVRFPGTYSVAKGERMSSVIARAGGFTNEAYFPGAIFTRELIRQQQVEENKRLLKQMQGEIASMEAELMDMRDKDLMAAKQRTLTKAKKIMSELAAVTPNGRLIIDLPEDGKVEGTSADVKLHNGDTIYIPVRPSTVLVMGQVYNPVALTFDPKLKREDYVDMSGGVTRLAKEDDIYVVHANGIVAAGRKLRNSPIKPGDTIIVPEDLDHMNLMDGTLTWTKALMQIGVSIATFKAIKVF